MRIEFGEWFCKYVGFCGKVEKRKRGRYKFINKGWFLEFILGILG